MKQNIVKVSTHGVLAEHLGFKDWNLSVKSVSAALNAIETLSKRKFYKFLHENDKNGIKYSVLINGKPFEYDKNNPPDINNPESIINTELGAKIKNLKTIDIVPVLEGAGGDGASWGMIVLGVVLIIVGIILLASGIGGPAGWYLITLGVALIAAGVMNLLAKGPELEDFKTRDKTSYLFSGPINNINEGAPVPVGYGRLLIGSYVISSEYDISEYETE